MIQIKNIKTDEFDRQNPGHVFCGRSDHFFNKLANPYSALKYGRENAIKLHKQYLWHQWKVDSEFKARVIDLACYYARTNDLALFCYCAPLACHTENIRKLINWLINTKQVNADHCPLDSKDFYIRRIQDDSCQDTPDKGLADHNSFGEAWDGMSRHASSMTQLQRQEFEDCYFGEKVTRPEVAVHEKEPYYLRAEYFIKRMGASPQLATDYAKTFKVLAADYGVVNDSCKKIQNDPAYFLKLQTLAQELLIIDPSAAPNIGGFNNSQEFSEFIEDPFFDETESQDPMEEPTWHIGDIAIDYIPIDNSPFQPDLSRVERAKAKLNLKGYKTLKASYREAIQGLHGNDLTYLINIYRSLKKDALSRVQMNPTRRPRGFVDGWKSSSKRATSHLWEFAPPKQSESWLIASSRAKSLIHVSQPSMPHFFTAIDTRIKTTNHIEKVPAYLSSLTAKGFTPDAQAVLWDSYYSAKSRPAV